MIIKRIPGASSKSSGLAYVSRRLASDGKSLEKSGGDSKGGDGGQEKAVQIRKAPVRCLMEIGKQRKAKVTLLACDNRMGQAAALSLKVNGKLLKEVRLWDRGGAVRGLAMDLSHIPSSVRTQAFVGEGQLEQALRNTDIAVVMGGSWGGQCESTTHLFHTNAEMVREMARAVMLSAPKAILGLAVPPVTPLLAFVGEIQRSLGAFCPEKLLGLLCLEEMRARSLLSTCLSLPPGVVEVKLTGGGTPASLVPVLEGGPGGEYLGEESIVLTQQFRNYTEEVKRSTCGGGPDLSAGLAVANFVRAAAEGMCTDARPTVSAMVRTGCLPGIPYLVIPVSLGPAGAESTPGIPKLSEREFRLLIQALPVLKDDIATGETWAHSKQHTALSVQCS